MLEKEIKNVISKRNLIEYIASHAEINYVAVVVTPNTFLNARTVLRYISDELGLTKPCGVIVVQPSQQNVWPIKTEIPIGHKYLEFYNLNWMKMELATERRMQHIFKALVKLKNSNVTRRRKVYVIHIDGIWDTFAMYGKAYSNIEFEHYSLSDPEYPYYNINEWFHVMYAHMKSCRSYFISKVYPYLRKKMLLSISGINVHTLPIYDRKFFFSRWYCKYQKRILAEDGDAYEFSPSKDYVLYLSNVYDAMTSKQITDISEEILNLFAKKGYEIYVKQHPREDSHLNYKSIKPKYIPNKYAVESLIASAEKKPSAVIGAETTSLAKIASFWKIPCYTFLDHPLLWGKAKFEWSRGYNDCAMRGIPEFKYSRDIGDFFTKEKS